MGKAGTIASRTAIYGVGQILRGLTSFIMLPIYTRYLAPADYGLVELLNVITDLTALLIGTRVAVGIFKYYSSAPSPQEKSSVLATAMMLLAGANGVGVLLLWLGAGAIGQLLDAPEGFESALKVFAFTLVVAAINEVFFSYLRVLDRPVTYVLTNLLKLVLQLSLNIWFIVFMEMNYWGIIWASLVSSLVLLVGFVVWLGPTIGLRFSKTYAIKLINFSVPIIIASLGMYYITFGDRYFLKYYQGLAAVGIYALAYKFGFLLFSLVWTPFSTYWSAQQFDHAKDADAPRLFGQVFLYANWLLLVAALGMVVVVPDFIKLFAAESYWTATEAVPWIVFAYVLQCWTEYCRFGILHHAQTRYLAYGTLLTAVIISGLYWYWIPREGIVGAGKATLVAFAIRFLYIHYHSQRLFHVDYPWVRVAALFVYLSLISYLLSLWPIAGLHAMLLKGGLLMVAVTIALFTPLLDGGHRSVVIEAMRQKLGRRG